MNVSIWVFWWAIQLHIHSMEFSSCLCSSTPLYFSSSTFYHEWYTTSLVLFSSFSQASQSSNCVQSLRSPMGVLVPISLQSTSSCSTYRYDLSLWSQNILLGWLPQRPTHSRSAVFPTSCCLPGAREVFKNIILYIIWPCLTTFYWFYFNHPHASKTPRQIRTLWSRYDKISHIPTCTTATPSCLVIHPVLLPSALPSVHHSFPLFPK